MSYWAGDLIGIVMRPVSNPVFIVARPSTPPQIAQLVIVPIAIIVTAFHVNSGTRAIERFQD